MQQEKKFYVYVHRYASGPKQGEVFYVGKGQKRRAWSKADRGSEWREVEQEYGRVCEIVHSNLSEVCSFTIEKILINIFGLENLINKTNGGEGPSGFLTGRGVEVHCSNGICFPSITKAIDYLRINGHPRAAHEGIRHAIIRGGHAYGFMWSTDGNFAEDVEKNVLISRSKYKRVFSSDGKEFESMLSAASWLRSNGFPRASSSKISLVANGKRRNAYGRQWSFSPFS